MPEDGQKSKLLSRFTHMFSKDEDEKVTGNQQIEPLKIGKLVLPDEDVKPTEVSIDTSGNSDEEAPSSEDLDIQFAQNLIQNSGKFIYCETVKELMFQIHSLKTQNEWGYIFAWESKLKDLFENSTFQEGIIGFTIENSNAAASFCEFLIADSGDILLSSTQATRRQLPVFPKSHIIICDRSQLKATLGNATEAFKVKHKDELPSLINLSKIPKNQLECQKPPVLEAVGPSDIYVFMTDESLT